MAVMLAPAIFIGYIENIFGVFLGVLMTLTFPAVIIDAFYAAIYIRNHPDYDELA